jgi:putative transposase
MDVDLCLNAIESAFVWGFPAIINSDQGSQYSSKSFTKRLLSENIQISMNGKG